MKTYRIYRFDGPHDNVADKFADFTWEELVDIFSEHRETPTKEDMMFIAGTFKTEDYIPAGYAVVKNGVKTGERRIKYDANGNTGVGKYGENLISYNCLVFDYDGNGNTLDVVKERFKGITHLGYTSYNHAIKGVDKCRVVIPLATEMPVQEFRRRKESIKEFAETDDDSTVAVGRAFYMPSYPKGAEKHVEAWHEDGLLLEWDIFEAKVEVIPEPVWRPPVKFVKGGTGKIRYETFDIVSFMKDQGLYIRPSGHGKHDVHCPNIRHNNGGTVIYEADGGNFYCSHASCKGFNFFDHYKKLLGNGWKNNYCLREDAVSKIIF